MMNTSQRWAGTVLIMLFVWAAGCGGGEPEEQPLHFAKKTTARPTVSAPPSVPIRPVMAANKKPTSTEPEEEEPSIDPNVDPNDVFAVVDDPVTHKILGRVPKLKSREVFLANAPAAGLDSSTFDVVELGTTPIRGEPDPDFELPLGFTPIVAGGYSEQGLPRRIRCERDHSVMALVSAGPFLQGRDNAAANAGPAFSHHLDDYYIDVTEVTLAQFERFRAARKEAKMRVPVQPLNASSPSNFPALGVLWGDARGYTVWSGKELPTEAEWEKAARGEEGFTHPWGNGRPIWPHVRDPRQITAVKTYRMDISPYGVFDLAGNAREWCQDWYSQTAYRDAAKLADLRNWKGPRSPPQPNLRVVKGNGPGWTVWHRGSENLRKRIPDVAFRCVIRRQAPKRKKDAEKQSATRGTTARSR